MLRDVLKILSWQHQKRNSSARFPSTLESWVQSWGPRARFAIFPLRLSKVLRLPRRSEARSYKVLRRSRKIILAYFSKLEDLMLQTAILSRNQRRDLLTSLMNMSLVLRLAREMHFCRSSSNATRLPMLLELLQSLHVLFTCCQGAESFAPATQKWRFNVQKWSGHVVFYHFGFEMCFAPQRGALPKVLWAWCVLRIFTSKCASRRNSVHIFIM